MDNFLRVTDEFELDISRRIEEKIKQRGRETSYLDEASRSFDISKDQELFEMKEILMKLQNCMFIRINHTLIPFDEKFSKIKYFFKRLIRKLIRWYIEPIIKQQNEYNSLIYQAIIQLNDRIKKNEDLIN